MMVQQFQFESCPFQWAISYRKVLVPIDDRVGTGLGTGNLNWMDAEERGFSPNAPLLTRTHPFFNPPSGIFQFIRLFFKIHPQKERSP